MNISYQLKLYLLLLFILNTKTIFAQNFEEIKGTYNQGSTAGIHIYPDGSFALYGYATLVFGVSTYENGAISFTPEMQKQAFSIMGRKNKKIKNGAHFTFTRKFDDDGPTFIKIDELNFQPIFDENYNGGSPYYRLDFAKKPSIVSLGLKTQNNKHHYNTNTFNLENDYNEFLLFYYPTTSAQKPFVGKIITENGTKTLDCTWGKFVKVEKKEKEDNEMLLFLNQYKKDNKKNKDQKVFYFNDQLKSVTGYNHLSEQENIFDINNYVLDENSNKYINKSIYQDSKNYIDTVVEEYHDENVILKYNLIEPFTILNINYNEIKTDQNSLFTTNVSDKNAEEVIETISDHIPAAVTDEPAYVKPKPVSSLDCSAFNFKNAKQQADTFTKYFDKKELSADEKFFCAFPNSFKEMQAVFGFDSNKGETPLYNYPNGENIIHYFATLNSISKEKYYDKYINICVDGVWEADNIREAFGFADKLTNDTEAACTSLSKRTDKEIKSVFHFIFDGPHPKNEYNEKIYNRLLPILTKQNEKLAHLLKESYNVAITEDAGHGH